MNSAANGKVKLTGFEYLKKYSVILTALILIVFATIASGGLYFRSSNMINVGERAAAIGIIALGQMLVILTGGMDLSVGGITSVGFCVTAMLLQYTSLHPFLVILLMLLATTACGAVNGIIVAKSKIPPFMLTLGTQMFFTSLALVLSKSQNLQFGKQVTWMVEAWHLDGLAGRLFPTALWIAASVIIILVLAYTRFGKNIYQTGGTELAARMSGIKTDHVKFMVYALSGFFCGLAALTVEFRLQFCNASSTSDYMISSVAAVIVGGTSLKGGEGNVYGTFVGAFIMASLDNIMNLCNLDVYSQDSVKGIVLLVFVVISCMLTNSSGKKVTQ
ncbi:MAG: ABC transporter permease [Lachnospiraceae bacterium]|nr:ABC transporter permease [Lachnospiraceae bacterium]